MLLPLVWSTDYFLFSMKHNFILVIFVLNSWNINQVHEYTTMFSAIFVIACSLP